MTKTAQRIASRGKNRVAGLCCGTGVLDKSRGGKERRIRKVGRDSKEIRGREGMAYSCPSPYFLLSLSPFPIQGQVKENGRERNIASYYIELWLRPRLN